MVDLQSKYRLYSIGYTAVHPRSSTPTLRELYHESGRKIFPDRKDRPVHDCRAEVMKNLTAPETWDAWLLSYGLRFTLEDCVRSHERAMDLHTPPEMMKPQKFLYQIGTKGSEPGDFNYPRGVCSAESGDIIVADSGNHRVQIFNSFGIFKLAFGKLGSQRGEFNEPTDVTELPNGDLAVADRRNKRVQIFTDQGKFLKQLVVGDPPYSVACDHHAHLVACTVGRTVEVFTQLQYCYTFLVPFNDPPANQKRGLNSSPLHVGMSDQGEIVVSDGPDQCIKVFGLDGTMLRQIRLRSHGEGLTCSPGGVFVTPIGQVMVADILNHSVSVYTTLGMFLHQVLVPTDGLGCVHSVSVGTEGHLIVSEFSMTGEHTVKMFRYRDCACHRGRVITCKKRKSVR
ncbi:hypothetical protein ACOMHN_059648 [Nucella lapillus]